MNSVGRWIIPNDGESDNHIYVLAAGGAEGFSVTAQCLICRVSFDNWWLLFWFMLGRPRCTCWEGIAINPRWRKKTPCPVSCVLKTEHLWLEIFFLLNLPTLWCSIWIYMYPQPLHQVEQSSHGISSFRFSCVEKGVPYNKNSYRPAAILAK